MISLNLNFGQLEFKLNDNSIIAVVAKREAMRVL